MSEPGFNLAFSELPQADFCFSRLMPANAQGAQAFKDGMASLGAAVNVVTTLIAGEPAGFTATAVTSVSDKPPTLLVCLNRSSSVYHAFSRTERLCVNTLAAHQEDVAAIFASKLSQPERFAAVEWRSFVTGAPLLGACSVAFDCKITSRSSVATPRARCSPAAPG